MIASYRPAARWATPLGLLVAAALTMSLLTGAQAQDARKLAAPADAKNRPADAKATPAADSSLTEEEQLNLAIEKKLRIRIQKFSFDKVSFENVLAFLREASGINITANWNALSQVGIERSTEVSVKLQDVSLEQALKAVLGSVDEHKQLGFDVQGGVLTISTREELASRVITRVYEIADILQSPCFADGEAISSDDVVEIQVTIQESVDPESWRPEGTRGSTRRFGSSLVTTQTGENHQAIAILLEKFRKVRQPPWMQGMCQKLKVRQDKVVLESVEYADALVAVAEMTGTNVVLDPQIEWDLPKINLRLKAVTAEQALSLIARMGGASVPVGRRRGVCHESQAECIGA